MHSRRWATLGLSALALMAAGAWMTGKPAAAAERHFIYVASPGTEYTDIRHSSGILVYDADDNFKFVKEIPTFTYPEGKEPRSVKGITASAAANRIFITDGEQLAAFDLTTDKMVWIANPMEMNHFDRIAASPDGKTIYAPGADPFWYVVDGTNGKLIKKIDTSATRTLFKSTTSVAHNTIFAADGSKVYLADARALNVQVVDPKTMSVVSSVGPFTHRLRPFTVNGSNTTVLVNIYELLGFEMGDVKTGKKLARVEVQGYTWDPKKPPPHSVGEFVSPSHGVAYSPDEKEIWVTDGSNGYMHVFDSTVMPPKQVASIKTRTPPFWVTFSYDGKYVFPSSGDIIDAKAKKVIGGFTDEKGQSMASEKLLEVIFDNGKPVRAGDQFGVGRVPARSSQTE